MSASKEFFKSWFKSFLISLSVSSFFLLLGFLDYTLNNKSYDKELFKSALVLILSISFFLYPGREIFLKIIDSSHFLANKFNSSLEQNLSKRNLFIVRLLILTAIIIAT